MIENLTEDLGISGISKGCNESAAKRELPAPTQVEMEDFYSNLSKCKSEAAVMSLITLFVKSYVLPS
ncbi:hypothetical protein P5673_018826 [Acropora cervicornis]|uniref:Uncharacterized protein n=1 Tax=Acropora cervicornis TaxID=6130 RepID=A0AAD9V2B2_ACRCE|nr:hypothetical protein P5673_018826 [Acropora cervicornis]